MVLLEHHNLPKLYKVSIQRFALINFTNSMIKINDNNQKMVALNSQGK